MYKVIQNDKVIDVIKHPKFILFLASGHIAMTDKGSATGVVGSDDETLYSFTEAKNDLPVVTLVEINEEEFSRLNGLLNSGHVVSADESALATAKRDRLAVLSGICKNKITSGFTIELSDNKHYSFKLTTEDQLNLMQIERQLAEGEAAFVYHATNQPCRVFLRDDMLKIIAAFRKHVLYHTTYYNAVKQYINSLADAEAVNLFNYGTDVAQIIDDPVLKQILKNGGS